VEERPGRDATDVFDFEESLELTLAAVQPTRRAAA
jgi:hypothetical protein